MENLQESRAKDLDWFTDRTDLKYMEVSKVKKKKDAEKGQQHPTLRGRGDAQWGMAVQITEQTSAKYECS